MPLSWDKLDPWTKKNRWVFVWDSVSHLVDEKNVFFRQACIHFTSIKDGTYINVALLPLSWLSAYKIFKHMYSCIDRKWFPWCFLLFAWPAKVLDPLNYEQITGAISYSQTVFRGLSWHRCCDVPTPSMKKIELGSKTCANLSLWLLHPTIYQSCSQPQLHAHHSIKGPTVDGRNPSNQLSMAVLSHSLRSGFTNHALSVILDRSNMGLKWTPDLMGASNWNRWELLTVSVYLKINTLQSELPSQTS